MRTIITYFFIALSFHTLRAQTLPLFKEGTKVSIPFNKKNTKGLDIFIKSMTYRDSTDWSCQANVTLELTSRNEKIHYAFNMFSIKGILPKNSSIEREVSFLIKKGVDRDSILTFAGSDLMYLPPYNPEEFIQKEKARKEAVKLANKARLDSIRNESINSVKNEEERCKKLLTPEFLANWVGASFFTKENIEKDCGVYPIAYSGGKVFYDFPKCPVTMEFTEDKQVCIYLSFRLFGEDGYNFRKELVNYGYKPRSKSNALVAENNFGDLTNGKVSVYKCALKSGGYSVCQITEGQSFMFEFYRSKK